MNRMLAAMFLFVLAGCVPMPTRVDTARTEGPDKSYTMDLPIGWIKQGLPDNPTLLASRNGFLLESIDHHEASAQGGISKDQESGHSTDAARRISGTGNRRDQEPGPVYGGIDRHAE